MMKNATWNNASIIRCTVIVAVIIAMSLCCLVVIPANSAYAINGVATADNTKSMQAAQLTPMAKKKLPSVSITPNTQSPNKKLRASNTYTKQLRNYWVISYYMNLFEKKGGGTLTLKKGTYQLPLSIQVPSNVTIVFENGVTIKKTKSTGTKRIKVNSSLFQMIAPSKYQKTGAVKKYSGTKNVTFIGNGKVVFDMAYRNPGCAIVMAHNQNMKFSGITFKNLAQHSFELDASKNVVIEDCKFINGKGRKTDEAINLDIPDPKTDGFNWRWAKMDRTPDTNVIIQNCEFKNLERGIGSHQYSKNGAKDVMHSNIKILNNTFTNVKSVEGCVVTYNWRDVTISGNNFIGPGKGKKTTYAIVAHSAQNVTIANNTISNYEGTIMIRRGFTTASYKGKPPAPVSLTDEQLQLLSTNIYVAGTVTYSDAAYTGETYYHSKMVGVWQPNTIKKHFKFYPLTAA